MTSSRLPGKVLMPGCGKPMLHHMVERLLHIPEISNVIIATTINSIDNCIVDLATKLNVLSFRGDEDDVLRRVVQAAQYFGTEIIIEITGDNPLVDPEISSQVIQSFLRHSQEIDFATNDLVLTFPIGFNTRAFSRELLEKVERKATHPVDREHVVNYICKRPKEFKILNIEAQGFYRRPDLRLTLDYQEDYKVIRTVFEVLYPKKQFFTAKDIYEFLDANPEIRDLNKNCVQKTYEYD